MKKLIILLILGFALTANAVTLQWDQHPNAIGFTVYYYKTSDPATVWNSAPISDTQYVLSDQRLERGQEYTFYATAYNSEGESGPSNLVTYTRPEQPYAPPNGNEPQIITLPNNVVITIQIGQ